ncbi:MAG: hypothetical protein KA157_13450 [Aliarcobacter sp.]|nr:hypothetical protein [Aliarcobacter sp.]
MKKLTEYTFEELEIINYIIEGFLAIGIDLHFNKIIENQGFYLFQTIRVTRKEKKLDEIRLQIIIKHFEVNKGFGNEELLEKVDSILDILNSLFNIYDVQGHNFGFKRMSFCYSLNFSIFEKIIPLEFRSYNKNNPNYLS